MARWFSITFILGLALFATNCGDGDQELLIVASPSQTFILPGEITFEDDSCYEDGSVSEPRIRFDQISTQWTGDGSFLPVVLKVSIAETTTVSAFECTITGEAQATMGAFLGFGGSTLVNSGSGATATSICPIHCGGITVNSENAFTVNATVELVGSTVRQFAIAEL